MVEWTKFIVQHIEESKLTFQISIQFLHLLYIQLMKLFSAAEMFHLMPNITLKINVQCSH